MDPLALLAEAEGAGLTVHRDGERLVVRGPKSAEAVARQLLDRKAEVLAILGEASAPREGFCSRHGRFLVLRELEAGCCGWCEPDRFEWSAKDRAAIAAMNAPRPARAALPCQSCGDPLPPDRWTICEACFDKEFRE